MVKRHRLRRFFNNLALLVVFCAAIVYFIFQAVSGDYGTLASSHYAEDVIALSAEKAMLEKSRDHWKHLNSLAGAEGFFDRDLLDEQARRVLGYVAEEDFVILLPDYKPLQSR